MGGGGGGRKEGWGMIFCAHVGVGVCGIAKTHSGAPFKEVLMTSMDTLVDIASDSTPRCPRDGHD